MITAAVRTLKRRISFGKSRKKEHDKVQEQETERHELSDSTETESDYSFYELWEQVVHAEDDHGDIIPTKVEGNWHIPLSKFEKQARGSKSYEHLQHLRRSNPCYGTLAPRKDRPAREELSYDPVTRWNSLRHERRRVRGSKEHAHLEVLRQSDPNYGSLLPRTDRPGKHESSYDPLERWTTVGCKMKQPRGYKSLDHLQNLRQSNPCYGSLTPKRDRPSWHEISYDPLTRWVAMAPLLRPARGSKSDEHNEVLRQSNPCYGSLTPKRDRPSRHEISYDPLTRWVAMAPLLCPARGSKSDEHNEVLRQSNPCYGTLMPSLTKYYGLIDCTTGTSTLEKLRDCRSAARDELQDLVSCLPNQCSVPLYKKTFNLDSFDEYSDDESSESGDGISDLPLSLCHRSIRESNTSQDSDLSNARTAERFSSDSWLESDFAEVSPKHRVSKRSYSGEIMLPKDKRERTTEMKRAAPGSHTQGWTGLIPHLRVDELEF